jgi:hypothetical protein
MKKQLIWVEKDEDEKTIRVGGMIEGPIEAIGMLASALHGIIQAAPSEKDKQEATDQAIAAIKNGIDQDYGVMQ